jgi:hypothetical protein
MSVTCDVGIDQWVEILKGETIDRFSNIQYIRRVWRYQRGNHNPYIEEEQTTQWPKEIVQKDKTLKID